MQQPPAPGPPPGMYMPPKKSGTPTWLIVLIVVPIALVFVLGILAAIAIPAFTKYMRRSKTAEARVKIATMTDSLAEFHIENGRCPGDGQPQGRAGLTPPRSAACSRPPNGRCDPSDGDWQNNPVWRELNFAPDGPHYFHYDFRWAEENGMCMFTAQAFGDLDDDGVFSTFERSGAADENGFNLAAGLFIDQEVE